jgi:tetratricopeptide (TPR) repeat protein
MVATKNKTIHKLPLWAIVLAYAAIALSHTIAHDWLIDGRFATVNRGLHEQVMTDNAPAPIQYRVMVYYAAEGLMRMGVSFDNAYFAVRFASTFCAALAFHYFLALYFVPLVCFGGALYFLAALPVTYIRYYMQPMDLPNLFFFLLGFVVIIKRKDLWLAPLIVVAMINRETAVLLSLVYLFYRWDELSFTEVMAKSALFFSCGIGTYWLLRKIFAVKHYYADLYYLGFNLSDWHTYFYAIALFGPFLILAFKGWGDKPKFFKRALLLIPFFLVIHFTMTIMAEPRLWLPLVPLFIGAGLWLIVPDELKAAPETEIVPVANRAVKYSRVLYLVLLALFFVFFAAFFQYYKNMHFKDRALQKRVESFVAESKRYSAGGDYAMAVGELRKALVLDTKNDAAHYELALIYDYYLHDVPGALFHFEKCLEYNPYHLDRVRIKDEIDRLKYYQSKQ